MRNELYSAIKYSCYVAFKRITNDFQASFVENYYLHRLRGAERPPALVHGKQRSEVQWNHRNFCQSFAEVFTLKFLSEELSIEEFQWLAEDRELKYTEWKWNLVFMFGVSIDRRNLQHSRWPNFEAVISRDFFDFSKRSDAKTDGSWLSHIDCRACNPDKSELLMHFSIISIMRLVQEILLFHGLVRDSVRQLTHSTDFRSQNLWARSDEGSSRSLTFLTSQWSLSCDRYEIRVHGQNKTVQIKITVLSRH